MDEVERVLERLERIQALNEGDAPPQVLLVELRELVTEAEEWARAEVDARARAAAAELGEHVARVGEVVPFAVTG
jgi:hypothetical protein